MKTPVSLTLNVPRLFEILAPFARPLEHLVRLNFLQSLGAKRLLNVCAFTRSCAGVRRESIAKFCIPLKKNVVAAILC